MFYLPEKIACSWPSLSRIPSFSKSTSLSLLSKLVSVSYDRFGRHIVHQVIATGQYVTSLSCKTAWS